MGHGSGVIEVDSLLSETKRKIFQRKTMTEVMAQDSAHSFKVLKFSPIVTISSKLIKIWGRWMD